MTIMTVWRIRHKPSDSSIRLLSYQAGERKPLSRSQLPQLAPSAHLVLPVRLMLTTKAAVFFELESLRSAPLIFRRCVVATPAFDTRQSNQVPHGYSFTLTPEYIHNKGNRPGPEGIYAKISLTTPAPTVRPPSRIAKRNSFSKAIGVINSTSTPTLSPGITISVPDGNVTTPVTSVVRK